MYIFSPFCRLFFRNFNLNFHPMNHQESMKILRLESLQLKRKKCPARGVGTRQLQIIVCDFDKFCFFC